MTESTISEEDRLRPARQSLCFICKHMDLMGVETESRMCYKMFRPFDQAFAGFVRDCLYFDERPLVESDWVKASRFARAARELAVSRVKACRAARIKAAAARKKRQG